MNINRLYVRSFRNIREAELMFSEGCNIFFGGNAEGKTNMLEAISICLGRSFRKAQARTVVPFDADSSKDTLIKLWVTLDKYPERESVITCEVDAGKYKISMNGIPLKSAAELYGEMRYVVFVPDDLHLIKGEPELRRNFIDNIAILQNPLHKKMLTDYKHAMGQRHVIFYEMSVSRGMIKYIVDQVAIWEEMMARKGLNVTFARMRFFELLREYGLPLYDELTEGRERLDMFYASSVFGQFGEKILDFSDKEGLLSEYYRQVHKSPHVEFLPESKQYMRQIVGVHKDDIKFTIGGHSAREYGSQGQLRSVALVMKLSEAEIIRQYNNEKPVVLLDEVLGELDEGRREFVVRHFDQSQVFITSCNLGDFERIENIRVWSVEGGRFELR